MRDWLIVIVLFIILSIMTITSALYARDAEAQAVKVNKLLERINITAQNRCMVKVVLSYPPPISEGQFDIVLEDFDTCVDEETGSR